MQSELMNKINNYKNPYIALANSLKNQYHEQGQGLIELIRFITKNAKDDINEVFFDISKTHYKENNEYKSCYKIKRINILDILVNIKYDEDFGWETGKPKELFVLLEKAGFNFTKDSPTWFIKEKDYIKINNIENKAEILNNIKELSFAKEVDNTIFGLENNPEHKSIALLSHVFSQMFPEDFIEKIAKYKTLHNAVKFSQHELIEFLVEGCNVDINLKDNESCTPLFYCETLETLEFISKYKLDWFSKNTLGKECLSFFAGVEDKLESNKMISFSQKTINAEMKDNPNIDLPSNYLQEKIRNSLLEMVQVNRNKKDLEEFMKRNNVTSVSDIFDEDGNSLAQMCLMRNNWARYSIFKDHYPMDHLNNNGIGSLEIIFSLRRVLNEEKAKQVFDELLLNGLQYKHGNFSLNILKEYMSNSSTFDLPNWYMNIEKNKNDDFQSFAQLLVGEEYAYKFVDDYKKAKETYSEEERIKAVVYLLLTHTAMYVENVKCDLPIDEIFYQHKGYYKKDIQFKIEKQKLQYLLKTLDVIDQNQHLHKIDYSLVWNKFEKNAVEHLVKSYHENQDNITAFINENQTLMNALVDRDSKLFKSILNDEFIENIRINKELGIKLEYALLSRETNEINNTAKNKKANKI
jgi:hypothetical protein